MAIAATCIWELNSAATASNANGGGFNPANAGMLTNLTTDANTANTASPVVSSAGYNFVAGDVGNWLYIQAGTNWLPGFYKIASVAANKATITASIGAVDTPALGVYWPTSSTATDPGYRSGGAGCATVGTPTNGTFTIDYSRSNACITSTAVADYTAVGASLTLTSATAAFTPVMVGNIYFQSTTGTGAFGVIGRYEIATYVNATTVTLDRTPNGGTASVACTGKIGGSLSLNSSDDAIFETMVAGNLCYVGNASSFTINGNVSISSAGSITLPIQVIGYNAQRGDDPTGSTRPTIAAGASTFQLGVHWNLRGLNLTITSASGYATAATSNNRFENCKIVNNSTTAGRFALTLSTGVGHVRNCEISSYRGVAIGYGGPTFITGSYIHSSNKGIAQNSNAALWVFDSVIADNFTSAIEIGSINSQGCALKGNTIIGSTSKRGTGILISATGNMISVENNIITGFVTGISVGTAADDNYSNNNTFFNNTSDVTNWVKGKSDIALDPQFSSVTERTGATATTTAGNHLVQAGATFQTWGVTAGSNYLCVLSGTGPTATMYSILSVDSETQITTGETLTANATADKVWSIMQINSVTTSTNMKAAGYPGVLPGGIGTGYMDIGALQQLAGAGTTGILYHPGLDGGVGG